MLVLLFFFYNKKKKKGNTVKLRGTPKALFTTKCILGNQIAWLKGKTFQVWLKGKRDVQQWTIRSQVLKGNFYFF